MSIVWNELSGAIGFGTGVAVLVSGTCGKEFQICISGAAATFFRQKDEEGLNWICGSHSEYSEEAQALKAAFALWR